MMNKQVIDRENEDFVQKTLVDLKIKNSLKILRSIKSDKENIHNFIEILKKNIIYIFENIEDNILNNDEFNARLTNELKEIKNKFTDSFTSMNIDNIPLQKLFQNILRIFFDPLFEKMKYMSPNQCVSSNFSEDFKNIFLKKVNQVSITYLKNISINTNYYLYNQKLNYFYFPFYGSQKEGCDNSSKYIEELLKKNGWLVLGIEGSKKESYYLVHISDFYFEIGLIKEFLNNPFFNNKLNKLFEFFDENHKKKSSRNLRYLLIDFLHLLFIPHKELNSLIDKSNTINRDQFKDIGFRIKVLFIEFYKTNIDLIFLLKEDFLFKKEALKEFLHKSHEEFINNIIENNSIILNELIKRFKDKIEPLLEKESKYLFEDRELMNLFIFLIEYEERMKIIGQYYEIYERNNIVFWSLEDVVQLPKVQLQKLKTNGKIINQTKDMVKENISHTKIPKKIFFRCVLEKESNQKYYEFPEINKSTGDIKNYESLLQNQIFNIKNKNKIKKLELISNQVYKDFQTSVCETLIEGFKEALTIQEKKKKIYSSNNVIIPKEKKKEEKEMCIQNNNLSSEKIDYEINNIDYEINNIDYVIYLEMQNIYNINPYLHQLIGEMYSTDNYFMAFYQQQIDACKYQMNLNTIESVNKIQNTVNYLVNKKIYLLQKKTEINNNKSNINITEKNDEIKEVQQIEDSKEIIDNYKIYQSNNNSDNSEKEESVLELNENNFNTNDLTKLEENERDLFFSLKLHFNYLYEIIFDYLSKIINYQETSIEKLEKEEHNLQLKFEFKEEIEKLKKNLTEDIELLSRQKELLKINSCSEDKGYKLHKEYTQKNINSTEKRIRETEISIHVIEKIKEKKDLYLKILDNIKKYKQDNFIETTKNLEEYNNLRENTIKPLLKISF